MPVMIKADTTLVGKPERQQPLEKPRRRWKVNTEMYLKERG
jgi:hypothetical protein